SPRGPRSAGPGPHVPPGPSKPPPAGQTAIETVLAMDHPSCHLGDPHPSHTTGDKVRPIDPIPVIGIFGGRLLGDSKTGPSGGRSASPPSSSRCTFSAGPLQSPSSRSDRRGSSL